MKNNYQTTNTKLLIYKDSKKCQGSKTNFLFYQKTKMKKNY